MTIRFQCAQCKRMLAVERTTRAAKVKCPHCGRVAPVPEASQRQAVALRGPVTAKKAGAEPPEEVPPVRFLSKLESDDEMDMTPMVDVTFLLLIFFMVTAAYGLQRSIEVPPPDQQDSAMQARTIEELEQDDDYVIVRIDRDNTVWVTAFGDESMAPSAHELLLKLREAREGRAGGGSKGPSNLLVLAHGDCRHETVVMALDAGNAVGMENIRLATADDTSL